MKVYSPSDIIPVPQLRYNENHDDSGKFASGSGGGESEGVNPKTAALREKLAQAKAKTEEMKKKAEDARSKADSARKELDDAHNALAKTTQGQIEKHSSDLAEAEGNLKSAQERLDHKISVIEKSKDDGTSKGEERIKQAHKEFHAEVLKHQDRLKQIGEDIQNTKKSLK